MMEKSQKKIDKINGTGKVKNKKKNEKKKKKGKKDGFDAAI